MAKLKKMVITTGIRVDKPTSSGNIYPKDVVERAIKDFNIRAKNCENKGSELNPSRIEELGEPTHVTKKLFINESGTLCAEIEILQTPKGQKLLDKIINSKKVIARPIMSIPSYIADGKDKEPKINNMIISSINNIMRVQLECT